MLSRYRKLNFLTHHMRHYSISNNLKEHKFLTNNKAPVPVFRFITSSSISIPVPWGSVEGKTWGNNSNAPVLVVHGRLDNCGTFDPLIPLLPQEYFYVCIDFPGHGKSSPFPVGTPLKFFDFVLTMKRVVDYFNWKEVTCLGHSFGVQTSLYLAAIYPELVTKIIALEIGLGGVETSQLTLRYRERFDQLLSLEKKLANRSPPSYSYAEAANRVKKNRWMSELTDEACSVLIKRSLVPNGNGFYFSTDQRFRLGVGPDLTGEQQISIFKQVKCPVLLILGDITEREFWAKADIVKEIYNYFKTEALNISMVTVSGNHDVHLNHPERVSPHIRSFLLSNPSIR
nr:PREDICTED: probable serine hydrolase [Bemisia tabaci]